MKVIDFDFDPDLLSRFLAFPRFLYAVDPNWRPDPHEQRLFTSGSGWTPIAAWRNFLAVEGEDLSGRLTASVNSRLLDERGRTFGLLGFFECADDLPTARLLVDSALGWLRGRFPEIQTVLAPMNFDTWHSYRLRTHGFDQPTFWMEPYNPPYYPALLDALGFIPIAQYVTKTVTEPSALMSAWEPYHHDALTRGVAFRTLNPVALAEELSLLYRLTLAIFRDNPFFVEIPETEFRAMFAALAERLDPDLLLFVLDPSGQPVGFSFTVPDHRQPRCAHIKTFGVLPQMHGAGLGAALAYEAYRRLLAQDFACIHHCLMHAGQRATQFDHGLAQVTREYALYSRPIK